MRFFSFLEDPYKKIHRSNCIAMEKRIELESKAAEEDMVAKYRLDALKGIMPILDQHGIKPTVYADGTVDEESMKKITNLMMELMK